MDGRAYSIFEIKSIDAERRIFSGIATTPETDVQGDIVEPLGLSYAPEIPLLLNHDKLNPVGWARLGKATKSGIPFTAQVAQIDEDGDVKRLVDKAWHSIKARLFTGVSIGIRSTREFVDQLSTGGLHWKKAEVNELSVVAFPANRSARISTVKSLDAEMLAATGKGIEDPPSRPGATGSPRKDMTKTASERIAEMRTSLKAKGERMAAIMEKEDRSPQENEELAGLKSETAQITDEIGNLEALESVNATLAGPVAGHKAASGSASRGGLYVAGGLSGVGNPRPQDPPGTDFARYVLAKMAGLVFQGQITATEYAQQRWRDSPRVVNALKAAVPAATTTDPTWASPLVETQTIASEFIAFLRPQTIIGRIPGLRNVPFNMRAVSQTSGGTAYWTGEGRAKPLTRFAFASTTLGFTKVAAISVLTDELVRFSAPSAEAIVRDALRDVIVERMDEDFIDPSNAGTANIKPASITNGVTPLASQGNSANDIRADIANLIGEFVEGNQNVAGLVLIMPNTLALQLSLMRNSQGVREFPDLTLNGGTLEGIPVVTSMYANFGSPTNNIVIALNANEILLADDGQVTVDASREASLEMDDAPSHRSSSPVAESTLVSMFQTNSVALRAERAINWAKRRTTSVQYMEDVDWSAGSP